MYKKIFIILILLLSTTKAERFIEISSNYLNITDSCMIKNVNLTLCSNVFSAFNTTNLNNTHIIIKDDQRLSNRIYVNGAALITITNSLSKQVEITCEGEKNGFEFANIDNLSIHGIILSHCGKGDINVDDNQNKIYSALIIRQSHDISIQNVDMIYSTGYSIFLADNIGKLKLDNVIVSRNSIVALTQGYSSGGGVFITFSQQLYIQQKSFIEITNCQFIFNQAQDMVVTSIDENHLPFGKGGGLTIFLLATYKDNLIIVRNVTFDNNKAGSGGAMYILFNGKTSNNMINFYDVHFNNNNASYEGGGVVINHINATDITLNNSLIFKHCHFISNLADMSGAFSFSQFATSYELYASVTFEYCTFLYNHARLAAAIKFRHVRSKMKFVNISSNAVQYEVMVGKRFDSPKTSFGAVYMFESEIFFLGSNFMESNIGTAFVMDCSNLKVLGHVEFNNNIGGNGGAISIFGTSRIFLNNQTRLTFHGNRAFRKGGAIHVKISGPKKVPEMVNSLRLFNCFFQFLNSETVSRPRNSFNGNVTFSNNHANASGHSIFTSTLHNCFSPDQNNLTNVLVSWRNFHIPANSIATHAIQFLVDESQWNQIYPGWIFTPNITLLDEMGNSVEEVIDVHIKSKHNVKIETNYRFVVRKNTISLKLLTTEHGRIEFNVTLSVVDYGWTRKEIPNRLLKPCYFGYSLGEGGRCKCNLQKNQAKGISLCYNHKIYLFRGRWADPNQSKITYDGEDTNVCPKNYCNTTTNINENSITGFERLFNPDKPQQCTNGRNESSRLCSQCIKGYSVALGGETCHQCTGWKRYNFIWITFLLALALFLIILFVLWLNIDIYSNYLNGFLFYYQTVTLLITTSFEYVEPLKTLIGWINLNSPGTSEKIAICFADGFNDFQKNLFNYFIPVWMIFVLFLATVYAKYRQRTFLAKKCLGAFTIISVLAYSDFTRITFLLIDKVTIDGKDYVQIYAKLHYHDGEFLGYLIFGIIAIILVVITFPILLIMSPWLTGLHCRYFVNNSARWQPIFDIFKHVFRRDYRWFASYYFLCRAVLLGVGTFLPKEPFQNVILTILCFFACVIFVMCSPYKDWKMNLFDGMILTNLTAVGILNLGVRSAFSTSKMNICRQVISLLIHIPLVVTVGSMAYHYIPLIYEKVRELYLKRKHAYKYVPFPRRSMVNMVEDDNENEEINYDEPLIR